MKDNKFTELSKQILELVGGRDNVSLVAHCFTRLRFDLKDKSLVNEEQLKSLPGTLGIQWSGDQLQIIIGGDVADVYKVLCQVGGFEAVESIDENLDGKKKLTVKGLFNDMIETVTACCGPVIMLFVVGGFLRLIVTLLGSTTFGILPDDSPFLVLMGTVGGICFNYFPVYIAYTASKRFGANTIIALMLACLLVSPELTSLMEAGFSVYGIPVLQASYAASFLPVLIGTWVLAKVEGFFKKLLPSTVRVFLYPICTVLVMLPLLLCIIGPISTVLGNGIAALISGIHKILGPVATGLVGALFPLLIATGMHHTLNAVALSEYAKLGYDSYIWGPAYFMSYTLMSICIVALIVSRKKETKAVASSAFLTISLGGISEPTLFGIMLKSKKALAFTLLGGFCGGFYIGLLGVKMYTMAPEGFPAFLAYSGGSVPNLVHGIIATAIAFIVPLVLGTVFGLGIDEDERLLFRKKRA